jgi:hypothetical protein
MPCSWPFRVKIELGMFSPIKKLSGFQANGFGACDPMREAVAPPLTPYQSGAIQLTRFRGTGPALAGSSSRPVFRGIRRPLSRLFAGLIERSHKLFIPAKRRFVFQRHERESGLAVFGKHQHTSFR